MGIFDALFRGKTSPNAGAVASRSSAPLAGHKGLEPPAGKISGAPGTRQAAAAPQQHPLDRYYPLVNGFISTASWQDAQLFMVNNPGLLDVEAAQVFTRIARIQPSQAAQNLVLIHKLAVDMCRDKGMDAGMAEILSHEKLRGIKRQTLTPVSGYQLQELLRRLDTFISSSDMDDRRQMVKDFPSLASDLALDLMAKMIENASDEEKRRAIYTAKEALARYKEGGA